jgi:superfamily II DNA or RNA helicase
MFVCKPHYQVLYSILHYMKSHKSLRHDKVVIASNFISTLNTIEPIVKASGHQFLRIDGSVASEKRQNIVDLFNNENSAFTVCLISVKAGGVGLNLIGANRLILFEPDYNPATDQQAIGRVWRVGQKKEVFIYRMVCASSIEESILGRQRHKNLLSTVITETTSSTRSSKAPDRMHCDSSTSQVSIDVSNYDFSSQAPGVLKELILPSRARDIGKVEKEKVKIEYDDVILNELLSDELVTCRIKVKAT